jgi:hypothetical protein
MLTKQEIFTKVYVALRERGFTRAVLEENNVTVCAYRGDVGPCAVGILMTDEEYSPAFEGKKGRNLIPHIAALEGYDTREGRMFVSQLQSAHDSGVHPEGMQWLLSAMADRYDLEVPA